jgi:hypothetical protein
MGRDGSSPQRGHARVCVMRVFGALNVWPHGPHRHAVSFVISFASVPTLGDPHSGQVGRVGNSVAMQCSSQENSLRLARRPLESVTLGCLYGLARH